MQPAHVHAHVHVHVHVHVNMLQYVHMHTPWHPVYPPHILSHLRTFSPSDHPQPAVTPGMEAALLRLRATPLRLHLLRQQVRS